MDPAMCGGTETLLTNKVVRYDALDGLRAVAALLVIVFHSAPAIPVLSSGAEWGVRVFFVLSGFLITGILWDAREKADRVGASRHHILIAFYLRRSVRIFPLAFLIIAACAVADVPGVRVHLWWYLTYMSNHLHARTGQWDPGLAPFWSLAVEEQFYLLWPALVLWTPRSWTRAVLWSVMLLAPLTRLAVAPQASAVLLVTRADALVMGALVAAHLRTGSRVPLLRYAIVAAVMFAAGGVLTESGCVMVAGVLVAAVLRGWAQRVLTWRPLMSLGTVSYGVYAWHLAIPAILHGVERRFDVWLHVPTQPGIALMLWTLAVVIPVATVSWHLYESPLNGLKHRWPYVRDRPPSVALPLNVETA